MLKLYFTECLLFQGDKFERHIGATTWAMLLAFFYSLIKIYISL
jgi:hypothetical protein